MRLRRRGGLGALVLFIGWALAATGAGAFTSWKDGRYEGVVAQTDWYTCGPAAVATLLHYYYGLDVDEADVLQLALAHMDEESHGASGGISALALVHALQSFGVDTVGYRLTADAVAHYFRRGGFPVIVHVTAPQQHYVVAVGMRDDYVLIADPSWGRRIERWQEFADEKRFSGVTLVPVPGVDAVRPVAARQREALEGLQHRRGQLVTLRGWVAAR